MKMLKTIHEFIPKTFLLLRGYNPSKFKKDLAAGITVGIVALPLAMAFAIASGATPEQGLFTAIIAGFLISFLGGSQVQIGGPTGAFVVIVYSVIERHGYEGLAVATIIAGGLLILMGILRLGSLIKFVPHPLIVGFTTGIALTLFSSQLKDLLGLPIMEVPVQFIDKWIAYFQVFHRFDGTTAAVGLGTVVFIFGLRRWAPAIPWGITSIILAMVICSIFNLPVETVASRFGVLPQTLPRPTFNFDFSRTLEMFPDAITIALLAGVESLLSAVISDSAIGGRHKPNCELIAQGIANIGSMLFGGIPATAAIARTATNVRTGAQTPIAGMIHAIAVFILLWTCAPLVGAIPLATLAAVIMTVAWQMSELPHFFKLMRTSKADVTILLSSFLLTTLLDLTVAVEVGMLMAAFFFMKRMGDEKHAIALEASHTHQKVEIYKIRGPCFFGVADRLKSVILQQIESNPKWIVFRMKHVPMLDATALQTLKELHHRCLAKGSGLALVDVQTEPLLLLKRYGLECLIHTSVPGFEESKEEAKKVD